MCNLQYQGLRQEQLIKQQVVWGRPRVNNGDTGVFLPRRYGTPPVEPPPKKSGMLHCFKASLMIKNDDRMIQEEGVEILSGAKLRQACRDRMIDDQDLGFFANFLGIFIFVSIIAYHFVMADPKYQGD
ncbi:hypothetical protein ACFE04_001003 [Oxalis oulophora]